MTRFRRPGRSGRQRAGASAVEFAIIAPLMLMFTFSLVEIGRMMMVKDFATQATREGARVAVLPSGTAEEVRSRVMEDLALVSVSSAVVDIEPADLGASTPGGSVTVSVRIDPIEVSWVKAFVNFPIPEITASTTMRRESTN